MASEKLRQHVNKVIDLTENEMTEFLSLFTEEKVSKKHFLIQPGDVVNSEFYVLKGCLKAYYLDSHGEKHIIQFAIEDWWISDFIAMYNHEPALLTVECITDSTVIEFNAQKLTQIYLQFPEFEPFQRKTLERHVVSLHKRILNQLQLTALERYNVFLEQYPNIEQHVPNYHIASYLGITQQSLSRVRAEKAKK